MNQSQPISIVHYLAGPTIPLFLIRLYNERNGPDYWVAESSQLWSYCSWLHCRCCVMPADAASGKEVVLQLPHRKSSPTSSSYYCKVTMSSISHCLFLKSSGSTRNHHQISCLPNKGTKSVLRKSRGKYVATNMMKMKGKYSGDFHLCQLLKEE